MLRKNISHLGWATTLMIVSFASAAQNKVVVIPLFGDEAPTSKVVFVTEATFDGNLGGPEGADDKCQAEADAVGSKVQGKVFKAWISGGLSDDFDGTGRVFIRYDLPYLKVDGTQIATNYLDLLDTDINSAIDVSAAGTGGIVNKVWTGIQEDGNFVPASETCSAWEDYKDGDVGQTGSSGATDEDWTEEFPVVSCEGSHSLYCFEQ